MGRGEVADAGASERGVRGCARRGAPRVPACEVWNPSRGRCDVRGIRVWARLLGLARVVVEDVLLDGDAVVVCVRPRASERGRCGICRRRCARYDWGEGRRRWRALDLGVVFAYVEAEAPRVTCRRHGVVVAAVPWARHGSWFTTAFEDQAAWLAVHASASAVAALMRTSWRAVGGICRRGAEEAGGRRDVFAELRRIGVDEISIRRGQRYLTVVIDHDSGRLIWAAPGRDRTTVETFLARLGEDRCAELELVSCDMAEWITRPIAAYCPNAEVCLDAFDVVKLATDALDEIRREVWNQARRSGQLALARELKGARFALWKNPENLTCRQQVKLAHIQHVNQRLYRDRGRDRRCRRPPARIPACASTHWAPPLDFGVKARLGPGMKDAGLGQPSVGQAASSFPGDPAFLAAARQRLLPEPLDLSSKASQRLAVVGHRVVAVMPGQDAGKPASLVGDRVMHPSPHLGLDRMQLAAHLLLARDPLELEPSVLVLRANVREAQKLERLGLAVAAPGPMLGGEPPELDQPRLVRMQLQTEHREPFAKIGKEALGLVTMLKARHVVVGEPHENHVPARVAPPPLVGPQIEHVVQVDV